MIVDSAPNQPYILTVIKHQLALCIWGGALWVFAIAFTAASAAAAAAAAPDAAAAPAAANPFACNGGTRSICGEGKAAHPL
jgi:hypothetical protein